MQSTTFFSAPEQSSVSDQELIEFALRGDQRGYEQLVIRYQNRLFLAIRNDVGCPILAEDIVQDAFIRAFLRLDSFQGRSQFYTWLYRIALNSRRNYTRANRNLVSLHTLTEYPDKTVADKRESPSDFAERREDRKEVRAALSRLDDHHRTILILREFEGFDYQTIAEILQVNMGTVRSRLSRARARLKRELKTYQSATRSRVSTARASSVN